MHCWLGGGLALASIALRIELRGRPTPTPAIHPVTQSVAGEASVCQRVNDKGACGHWTGLHDLQSVEWC